MSTSQMACTQMKRTPRRWARLLACGAGLLVAQFAGAANLSVAVLDRDGRPVADAVITVVPVAVPGRPAPVVRPPTVPSTPVVLTQEKMQFLPGVLIVPVGTTVRFTNRDTWDHHVRGNSPAKNFELRIDAADAARLARQESRQDTRIDPKTDVLFDKAGPVPLGCFLHSSMRGSIFVTDTPHFARTDANGLASLADLPEGEVEVRLWHPDALIDIPSRRANLTPAATAANPVKAEFQLNFVPRRRRSAA